MIQANVAIACQDADIAIVSQGLGECAGIFRLLPSRLYRWKLAAGRQEYEGGIGLIEYSGDGCHQCLFNGPEISCISFLLGAAGQAVPSLI